MDVFKINTTEMHTGGCSIRIIEQGFPKIKGNTFSDKWKYTRENLDFVRKMMLFEPRGHLNAFGVILVEPDIPDAVAGLILIHTDGYATMCGDAVIACGRYVVDQGLVKTPVEPETKVVFQCPCGPVEAFVEYNHGKTGAVRLYSVPSFVFATDVSVEVPNFGQLRVDICYGGAFYAIIPAQSLALDVKSTPISELMSAAIAIKHAVVNSVKLSHPDNEDLAFLYGVILTDGNDMETEAAQIVVFADQVVSRSPCGSGTTARVALQYRRQQIAIGQSKTFSGATGARFQAKPIRETKCGPHDAVLVEISGKAQYLGSSCFTAESDDEIGKGFLLK